jgi:hypothetical protein
MVVPRKEHVKNEDRRPGTGHFSYRNLGENFYADRDFLHVTENGLLRSPLTAPRPSNLRKHCYCDWVRTDAIRIFVMCRIIRSLL